MKVLVADDHELFLKGLELILTNHYKEFELVTATSYSEIFEIIAKENDFALILTDLAMPGAHWRDALQKIHQALPETPIMILSAVFEKEIIKKTIDIGAAGYISKASSNNDIIQAIDIVLSGGAYIPQELLDKENDPNLDLLKGIEGQAKNNEENNISSLSPRQHDVLKLIAKGLSNKQIAYELGLTEGTVKLYITALFKLLKVYNRTSAMIKAHEWGILKNDNSSK